MDILYIGITIGFFVLTWGLVKLCDRLTNPPGDRS